MINKRKNTVMGMAIAAGMLLAVSGLFALNFWLPLSVSPLPSDHFSNFISRIWTWLEYASLICGVILMYRYRSAIRSRDLVLAMILCTLNWSGNLILDKGMYNAIQESIITAIAFIGAISAFRSVDSNNGFQVKAFEGSISDELKGITLGIVWAIPLSVVNIAYFWFTLGPGHPGKFITAFIAAMNPAISEEIIFRYLVIALCLVLLNGRIDVRLLGLLIIFLAVVPHSMAHLPDIMLSNPATGIFLLLTTSLLFGLPMALLQIKKSLESAITLHWFIDFTRIFLGYF